MLTSKAEREISDGCDDDEYDNPEVGAAVSHSRRIDCDGRACKKDYMEAKVKQVLLSPFAKSKKKKKNKQNKTSSKLSSFSSSCKRICSGDGICSGFCCTLPRTLESPADSIATDPNDATFTYDMLKTLIENNHFYSKECNPHSI
ncbi:hypothetical protein DITRI_Ditri20bG0000400 [Diplodiscus trichospermus]